MWSPAPPVLRPALIALLVGLSACAPSRLVPAEGGGVAFRTDAAPAEVRAATFALAHERGHPARSEGGVVQVELAGRPMSERPSRWLRVTVEPRGTGSDVTVVSLPDPCRGPVVGCPPGRPGTTGPFRRRTRVSGPALDFAEALASGLRG